MKVLFDDKKYSLAEHPSDPTALIVIDENGAPVTGKRIIVGEAEINGDAKHNPGKGAVGKSDDGTKDYRLRFTNDGVPYGEEVI